MIWSTAYLSSVAVVLFLSKLVACESLESSSSSDVEPYKSALFVAQDHQGIRKYCERTADKRIILQFGNTYCGNEKCTELSDALKICEKNNIEVFLDSAGFPTEPTQINKFLSGVAVKDIFFKGIYIRDDAKDGEAKIGAILREKSNPLPIIVVVANSLSPSLLKSANEIKLDIGSLYGLTEDSTLKSVNAPISLIRKPNSQFGTQLANDAAKILESKDIKYLNEISRTGREALEELSSGTHDLFRQRNFGVKNKTELPAESNDKTEPPAESNDKTEPPAESNDKTEPPAEFKEKTELTGESNDKTELPAELKEKIELPAEPKDKTEASKANSVLNVDDTVTINNEELKGKPFNSLSNTGVPASISSTSLVTAHPQLYANSTKDSSASIRIKFPVNTETITETHTVTTSSESCDDKLSCQVATAIASYVVRVELCVSVPTDCVVCQPKEARVYKCLTGDCPEDKIVPVTKDFGTPVTRLGMSAVAGEGWTVDAYSTDAPVKVNGVNDQHHTDKTITLTSCEDQKCRSTAIPVLAEPVDHSEKISPDVSSNKLNQPHDSVQSLVSKIGSPKSSGNQLGTPIENSAGAASNSGFNILTLGALLFALA